MKKLYFYPIFVLLISLLLACSASKQAEMPTIQQGDALAQWKREQRLKLTRLALTEHAVDFIALGIAKAKNWGDASDKAKLEADFNLPETVGVFVKSAESYVSKTGVSSKLSQFISSSSEINVRNVKYQEMSRLQYQGEFYVAMLAIKNRREYLNENVKNFKYNQSEKDLEFLKKANEEYNKIIQNK